MVSDISDDDDQDLEDEEGLSLFNIGLLRLLSIQAPPASPEAAGDSQTLMVEAWEKDIYEESVPIVLEALTLNPRNADALLFLLDFYQWTGMAEIEALARIVEMAEEDLGEAAFTQFVPHFWGVLETRPYMRARERLGHRLLENGFLDEAAAEFGAMLELNPTDNQGVRYELLTVLLAQGQLKSVLQLMQDYPGECEYNTVFAWGKVLVDFLLEGAAVAANSLRVARAQNPYAEGFASGRKRLPHRTPLQYQPGSEEEAKCFASLLNSAWKPHRKARKWLKEREGK